MGVVPSFPIKQRPTNFVSERAFNSSGNRRKHFSEKKDVTLFESLTATYYERFLEERRSAQVAKAKFNDLVSLAAQFPQWDEGDIADFQTQFKSFDNNHDGLIDFPEIDKVLTDIGDKTPLHIRKQKFDEIDVDRSNSIDFEEFLQLIYSVMTSHKEGTSDSIGHILCTQENKMANIVRHLTAEQQIQMGLF